MSERRRAGARMAITGFLLAVLAACAHEPSKPFVDDNLVQLTARVTAIEPSLRLVSLQGPEGR